jgi:hypothetical protein
MTRWFAPISLLLALAIPAVAPLGPAAFAEDIRYRDDRAELTVAAVSERTVQIVLTPFDEKDKPRTGPPSTVLVEQKPDIKLRSRELTEAKEVPVGKLTVKVKPGPLTVTVSGPSGKAIQELAFADDGSMTFRTDAPVLGMGEGGQQFDRRGHYHRLVNGQVAPLLTTHGGTILVPFLIGTDGWAMFVHRPFGDGRARTHRPKSRWRCTSSTYRSRRTRSRSMTD